MTHINDANYSGYKFHFTWTHTLKPRLLIPTQKQNIDHIFHHITPGISKKCLHQLYFKFYVFQPLALDKTKRFRKLINAFH